MTTNQNATPAENTVDKSLQANEVDTATTATTTPSTASAVGEATAEPAPSVATPQPSPSAAIEGVRETLPEGYHVLSDNDIARLVAQAQERIRTAVPTAAPDGMPVIIDGADTHRSFWD